MCFPAMVIAFKSTVVREVRGVVPNTGNIFRYRIFRLTLIIGKYQENFMPIFLGGLFLFPGGTRRQVDEAGFR